jgi:hypothetical protein
VSGTVGELHVVAGLTSELRDQLAERVKELRATDPLSPITVLVGGSLQRPFLQRWLAERLGAHANLRVLMPGDLALLLGARELVEQGRRALPPLADRVLLAEVAQQHPGYFAPVAGTPGFGEALFRLVRELRGAGFDLSAMDGVLDGATDAAAKAGSLAEILAAFEARRGGFYGPDDALAVADPEALNGLGLLVWGLVDMPAALETLVSMVSERMPVDVYLPDVPVGEDAPVAELRARLTAAGARLREPDVPPASSSPTTLARVRESLFCAPSGDPVPPDGSLRMVSAPDPSREVRAAARACLDWGREGVPFFEMAVAYRHGEAYLPLVEAVFVEAGVPVYLHEGSPLAERPLGRQTLGLLALRCTRSTAGGSRRRGGIRCRVRRGSSPALSSGSGGSPPSIRRSPGLRSGWPSAPRTPADWRSSSLTWRSGCRHIRLDRAGLRIWITCKGS